VASVGGATASNAPSGASGAASVGGPAPSAIDQFRAGTVDVNRYLDLKVEEATAHLAALPPAQLDAIRGALRERLATDPALADLVRTATARSAAPAPSDD
jgi:hypothetical protein